MPWSWEVGALLWGFRFEGFGLRVLGFKEGGGVGIIHKSITLKYHSPIMGYTSIMYSDYSCR